MDAAQAISLVVERIHSHRQDYPTQGLAAARIQGGWCVYARVVIEESEPAVDPDMRPWAFLVSAHSGSIDEVSSRESLEEACLWFTAAEPVTPDSAGPMVPDLGLPPQPRRTTTAYDRQAADALAQALTHERDFAGWLAGRLSEVAEFLGGSRSLISRYPNAFGVRQVEQLVDMGADDDDSPTEIWRSWPVVDPATLPVADTAGWLLIAFAAVGPCLEDLESQTPAATQLADAIADRFEAAPPWRACGVSGFVPQLIALPLTDQLTANLDELRRLAAESPDDELLRETIMLLAPSPGDADIEALLRLAIDAEEHRRDVIDLDAAAAAAYRRVLDRLGLPFETAVYNMMFE
jgi:hypothetical protein